VTSSRRELRLWPDFQNSRRQHMSRRMTKALNVRHLCAHFRSFAFFLHLLGGEINHEGCEEHGEFRIVISLRGTLAIWGARAASPQRSAACRAQIPSASCRRVQAGCLRSPETEGTPCEKQRLFTTTPRIIVENALLITCVGIALRELRARRDTSC